MCKRGHSNEDIDSTESKKQKHKILLPFYWILILPFLPVKDLFKSQGVCSHFFDLVRTSFIWGEYFSRRGITFRDKKLRLAIIEDHKASFMYTRIFVASDVLKEFLNTECCLGPDTEHDWVYDSPLLYCSGWYDAYSWADSMFVQRQITVVDPVCRDVITKVSATEKGLKHFQTGDPHWRKPELYVGTRNLSQYKEWMVDLDRHTGMLNLPVIEKTEWCFNINMLQYQASILKNMRDDEDMEPLWGTMILSEFWDLTLFETDEETGELEWDYVLEDLSFLFEELIVNVYDNMDDENVISPEHCEEYLKTMFDELIHKYKMCY